MNIQQNRFRFQEIEINLASVKLTLENYKNVYEVDEWE